MQNRIRELREAANLTLETVAERAGTSPQQISRLEKGERKLSPDWMRRVAKALAVRPSELLEFEGTELGRAPDAPVLTFTKGAGPDDGIEFQGAAYVALPVFDVNVSAGPGAINADRPEPEAWHLFGLDAVRSVTRAKVRDLAIVRVSGDSMASTLQNGDFILVDRSVRAVGRDGLYVLAAGVDVQVKRISRDWASKTLTLTSDNPAYPASAGVREDDVSILGRVVWLSRSLGG